MPSPWEYGCGWHPSADVSQSVGIAKRMRNSAIARKKDNPVEIPAEAPPDPQRWAKEDADVQLMLRFKNGDRSAFDELVRRNVEKIHALVFRFLSDPGMVEDLTQEVFLRVYRTAERYEPTAKFSTWLYRIVANLSFNVLRDRKKGHSVQLELPGGDDDDGFHRDVHDEGAPSPLDLLRGGELGHVVSAAVSALPENQRIAIILNKYENKNYEEIADILDCSTMAVKSLLSRARGNLRESLQKYVRPE